MSITGLVFGEHHRLGLRSSRDLLASVWPVILALLGLWFLGGPVNTAYMPGGTYELGWRHVLASDAREGVESFFSRDVYMQAFSLSRQVVLEGFEIQTEGVGVEALLGDVEKSELYAIDDLTQLCDLLDCVLAPSGWRLPTEDELEAALGGSLFVWGDEIPSGTPYEPGAFERHQQATANGLVMPHNTYTVELVREAFKMGDGGSAVCGGYPWPVAWLTLSPCARVPPEMLEDLFVWIENALVHPVR